MLALAAALTLALQAPPPEPLGRAADGRLITNVTIEGRGPWPFIVDTGASHTAIADVLAVQFGYTSTGALSDVQTLTEEIRAERLHLDRLDAAGVTARAIDAVVVETPTDLDLHLYGLLGSDMFAGHTIALDLAAATLTRDAAPPRHADARLDDESAVPLGVAEIKAARRPVLAMIDTGSSHTIVNSVLARRLRPDRIMVQFDILGATRIARRERGAQGVLIRDYRIGGVCGRDLFAVHADVDMFRALGWTTRPAMIIGVDALANATLTLDYETGAVEISPSDAARCES